MGATHHCGCAHDPMEIGSTAQLAAGHVRNAAAHGHGTGAASRLCSSTEATEWCRCPCTAGPWRCVGCPWPLPHWTHASIPYARAVLWPVPRGHSTVALGTVWHLGSAHENPCPPRSIRGALCEAVLTCIPAGRLGCSSASTSQLQVEHSGKLLLGIASTLAVRLCAVVCSGPLRTAVAGGSVPRRAPLGARLSAGAAHAGGNRTTSTLT